MSSAIERTSLATHCGYQPVAASMTCADRLLSFCMHQEKQSIRTSESAKCKPVGHTENVLSCTATVGGSYMKFANSVQCFWERQIVNLSHCHARLQCICVAALYGFAAWIAR